MTSAALAGAASASASSVRPSNFFILRSPRGSMLLLVRRLDRSAMIILPGDDRPALNLRNRQRHRPRKRAIQLFVLAQFKAGCPAFAGHDKLARSADQAGEIERNPRSRARAERRQHSSF